MGNYLKNNEKREKENKKQTNCKTINQICTFHGGFERVYNNDK